MSSCTASLFIVPNSAFRPILVKNDAEWYHSLRTIPIGETANAGKRPRENGRFYGREYAGKNRTDS
jgi:hypothetical protein